MYVNGDWIFRGYGSGSYSGQLWAKLIKTKEGPVDTGQTLSLPPLRASVGGYPPDPFPAIPGVFKTFIFTSTQILPYSCRIHDVTVPLGEVPSSAFTGMGSSAGSRPFTFDITSCPAGMTKVSYTIHPIHGVIDARNGVAKLSADSTAQGVGIRLSWTDSGAAVPLDQELVLSQYTGQAGDFPLKLTAAYYQTNATISPGSADATFVVTMSYE